MILRVHFSLLFAVILCTSVVHAKTAVEVFEQVSPSVVVIKTYDATGKGQSLGSGVILEDGVVVTNCHVVKEAVTIQVERQETKYQATLRHSDWDRDVCSLAIEGLTGHAVIKGSTSRLRVGDKVYAVGAPKGLELTLSDGLISSLRSVIGGQYLQITAPISPGSSGGGLFDDEGRLIGLPTFYLSEGQQLNFAVPVEWVNELTKRTNSSSITEKTTLIEWFNKAIELEKKKDRPGLLNYALRWTKAQPGDVYAWTFLGIAYGESNQLDKAIEACRQAIRINPKHADAWYNLGSAYRESNQHNKAIEAYRQAIRINPEHADAWGNLGIAYEKSNQLDKTIEAYLQAIRINPKDDRVWYNLGIAYRKLGLTAKAIETFQQAIRINPEHADVWTFLGIAYGESNQLDKALEAYQQAIRINPEHSGAWNNLGGAYLLSNQPDKAIDAFLQAIRINSEDADVLRNLGIAYKQSGQTSQVMEVYKRLKTLDPALADQLVLP